MNLAIRVSPDRLFETFLTTTLAVLVAVGITLALGAALTRREVERTALGDLAHQADLLAGRERAALLPLAHLDSLRPFLRKQGEQVATPLATHVTIKRA